MPKVNPEILRWARETARLSPDEAARKLGIAGERAADRLSALEEGRTNPSRPMLVKMSEKYRRPLLTFYLSERPLESDNGQDFRTLHDAPAPGTEALLDALLRDVQARQGIVKAALEEAEDAEPLAFIDSARTADGPEAVAESMRATLGVTREAFRQQRTANDAFNLLRAAAERVGVFVLLMGNLGSHHTDIDARVFRGFSIADSVAPFVVVNERDSRAAWSFTLLHELAHLWLGQTGVSGYDGEAQIEKFCDLVAARFLLDPRELRDLDTRINLTQLKGRIETFAAARNLSRKMVAYNLMQAGTLPARVYDELSKLFDAERNELRRAGQERENESGPNYYVVRRHRVGPALIDVVRRMLSGRVLSSSEAGRVLGVKPTNVARLLETTRAA
jgi:Zn-dependent peptidase ImmA (M78 family)/transcriptional regulator with XRE-family HTH domain